MWGRATERGARADRHCEKGRHYANRLTNVDINGTMAATYTYDALGRRIGVDDSGTQMWTVYNGKTADDNPYADFTSTGTLQTRYLDGLAVDELFARTSSSGATAWYLRDQVGSFDAEGGQKGQKGSS